jgi:hypothetical protein
MYQKGQSRITACKVFESADGKEKMMFIWDDMSSCVQRLIVNKKNRCILSTTVLHSVTIAQPHLLAL